jgi:hypothetical protein
MAGSLCAVVGQRNSRRSPRRRAPLVFGHLELYDEDRERLKAWTIAAIDVTDEERKVINQDKHRQAEEHRRRKNGAKPQAKSLSRTKPWEAMGIGRTKYYAIRGQFRDGPFFNI